VLQWDGDGFHGVFSIEIIAFLSMRDNDREMTSTGQLEQSGETQREVYPCKKENVLIDIDCSLVLRLAHEGGYRCS
jgi:hypothetical protein